MILNEPTTVVIQLPPMCLNRQAAIAFSSFKASYFDEQVRPLLTEIRAGTSVVYLREEVEAVIRNMFLRKSVPQVSAESGGDKNKAGEEKWERKQAASIKAPTAAGRSISTSTGYDFANALKALKTRKAG